MLERISIKNLALISAADLEFSGNLNVLSGETGAGKSIVVDALMLLMGGKYTKNMLSFGAESGFVEGVFSFTETPEQFIELGLCDEGETEIIIRRRFSSDGKNDIRINGRSATAGMLKGVMTSVVNICGQNEYQTLAKKSEHAKVLDDFLGARIFAPLQSLSKDYNEHIALRKRIAAIGNSSERLQKIDILTYQIDEIEKAAVGQDEEEELLQLRQKIASAEKIRSALVVAMELSAENGAFDRITAAERALTGISHLADSYGQLSERLSAVCLELDDISALARQWLEENDYTAEDMDRAESRLALFRNLKRKYGDISRLNEKLSQLKGELEYLTGSDEEYSKLVDLYSKQTQELYNQSLALSSIRREGAAQFEQGILCELAALGMPNSQFRVVFSDAPSLEEADGVINAAGFDDISFLLSPNPGQPLLPLADIISGGEMSRFMLALKVISSKSGSIDTMIFDEIDTGISGNTGQEVAKKLAVISRSKQVICVTHLPQIAAMADSHYFIEKHSVSNQTQTSITSLSGEGMVNELSRLLGAQNISKQATATAAELKAWCNEYKRGI